MSKRMTSPWALGALVGASLLVAACQTHEADAEPATPAAVARGVYALDGGEGDLLILAFDSADHYWAWKNTEECRDLSVLRDSCKELGRYVADGTTLTLTPDGGAARSYPFTVGPADEPSTAASALSPQADGLVTGTSGGLVKAGQATAAPVAGSVSLGGRGMQLVERGVQLLTTCQARAEGSGAIPGAPSPSSNYANGQFTSGPFAPGGQYSPATQPSGAPTLYANASTTDHNYALLSDRLPSGTTFAQANAALQRFNGPTGPALQGQGDDPNSTSGWVVDPLTGEVPVGCVTFERGNGWARNTTQAVHPFVGTITRYVVDGGNGSYRILTVGAGVTPPSSTGDSMGALIMRTAEETVSGARNLGNVLGGPSIFRQLDVQLINSLHH